MKFLAFCFGFALAVSDIHAADPGIDFFESKIRPALVENCYGCHSAEAKKEKGSLRLDTRDAIRKGGDSGPAIVPGKPAESVLLKAIKYGDADLKMPPKGKLPDAVIADIEKWIALGAPDPRSKAISTGTRSIEEARRFWSLQPLSRPTPPTIQNPTSEIRNAIDRFIVAKQQAAGVRMNPPADRRTLVRRVYFDLIGLPPTPKEADAFVSDPDPDAYAKMIDKLLASPHYGERWGRHWLDLARFGESSGYEHDNDRPHSYQYRDFVIESLNRDVPFDRFVRWQIAGDELEPSNPLARKATGFLAVGAMNGQVTEREAESARYEVFDDWVSTIGTGILGLTVGCARCHDHKYDPISTTDYYRLAANFTKAVRANVNLPTEPAAIEARELPAPWVLLVAKEIKANGTAAQHQWSRQSDGSYLLIRVNGEISSIDFVAESPIENISAVRIDAVPDESLPNFGPGLGDHGNFALSEMSVRAGPADGKQSRVVLKSIRSTTGPPSRAWSVDGKNAGREQSAIFDMTGLAVGKLLRFQLSFPGDSPSGRQAIGRFRLSLCTGEVPKEIEPKPVAPTAKHEVAFVVTENLPPYRMMIQGPDLFEKTFVLKRGDVGKKECEAKPGVLPVLSRNYQRSSKHPRTDLANWLTDVDRGAGALVARVAVNRLWQHHMGRGIVGTPSDFGAQGDRPTHPELLDWLAGELIAHGWSLKSIHREILLSATYRQSSSNTASGPQTVDAKYVAAAVNPQSIDPDNRLSWRRPLVRLEAEAIRDAMLAVSGRLDRRQFGPGSLDEGMTRRSIYFTVKRSALIPSMVQLDWPEALQGIGQRVTTTVAPQALLMLNSPHVRANAAAFARTLQPAAENSLSDAVDAAYLRAICRSPAATERNAAVEFLTNRRQSDGLHEALTDFCQSLFAMNEFLYIR